MNDKSTFDSLAAAAQGDVAAAAAMATNDAVVRTSYQNAITTLMSELRRDAEAGRISWTQAAERAQEGRNFTMEAMRGRSSPVGRAIAEQLKAEGKTLNELVAKYAMRKHGPTANFNTLSAAEKDAVFAEIVLAAARSNPRVNFTVLRLSRAGRGLILLSIAVSVYNIATAEDKTKATGREVAVTAGGILGGMAGGALAGLACGPGAPACSTIGVFVGGGLAAFGIDMLF